MRRRGRSLLTMAAINVAVLAGLLVPVELVFGTWVRPMGMADLKRFSIPIGVQFEFDTSRLYGDGTPHIARYSRDEWGLRGSHGRLDAIEVLTVGGSTAEQRYLDDGATWQAVAERRLRELGTPLVIANAGVDGQSTVGHLFSFEFWFPALTGLHPKFVLFYVGTNDVLRHEMRTDFDSTVDARSWRRRSATYQLLRTLQNNFRARRVGVYHGKRPALGDEKFTERGLLSDQQRAEVADAVVSSFLRNVEALHRRTIAFGARPVFMTQTALAWSANPEGPARGLTDTITIHGVTVNYSDVSYLHRELNRRLLHYCRANNVACFDLARDVAFDGDDYYDYLHNTPAGAAKIGTYLAEHLRRLIPVGEVRP